MFEFILKPIRKRYSSDRVYYQMLDDIFGLYPNNIELYKLALVHRSASIFLDDGRQINNERLEFLGDAIIESVVSDHLFIEYPDADEGFLTQLRSKIVSRNTLNELCKEIGLDRYVIYQSSGSYTQKHLWGDALEAIIGAIYLDKGYEYVNRLFINRLLEGNIDVDMVTHTETDFKSRLIEWCQKSRRTIQFETSFAEDSTPKSPKFHSVIIMDGLEVGYGEGSSKKEAEQDAAKSVAEIVNDEVGDTLLDMFDKRIESLDNRQHGAKTNGQGDQA